MPVLSENAVARVGYAGSDKDMGVRILGEWERGEITMVMSASSGPKDYVKNLIAMALETPHVERLRMLCGEYKTSVPFCVLQIKGHWFDITGKEVVFKFDAGLRSGTSFGS